MKTIFIWMLKTWWRAEEGVFSEGLAAAISWTSMTLQSAVYKRAVWVATCVLQTLHILVKSFQSFFTIFNNTSLMLQLHSFHVINILTTSFRVSQPQISVRFIHHLQACLARLHIMGGLCAFSKRCQQKIPIWPESREKTKKEHERQETNKPYKESYGDFFTLSLKKWTAEKSNEIERQKI